MSFTTLDAQTAGETGLARGFSAPLRGGGFLLRRPRLWPLAIAPFLINLGLFVLFFWFSYTRFDQWVRSVVPAAEGWWWVALIYLLTALVVILLLVVEVYLFAVVGNLLACPFLELLTRRVEREAAGRLPEGGQGLRAFLAEVKRVGLQQLKKLVLYVLVLGALLLLNLVPGVGSAIYAVLAWLITCFFLVLEFVDYPLDRRQLTLKAKLAYVWNLQWTGLGLGAALFFIGVIPILNLAFLPMGAVGATLVYLENPLDIDRDPPPPPPPGGTAAG